MKRQTPAIEEATDRFLTTAELARMVRKSPRAIELMRQRGGGPPYYKTGHRSIVYRLQDIAAWLTQCRRASTSDLGESTKR
ncbi:MAG TPA: helix-turn-helix domain-containing protein [Candidatus Binataceae bacterium]|jgi:predicted DNA-binding transcriptional regulator AlpA|nr:helix-turn-helix domain-containing protein [Candidatus Binataceae bacterium]